MRELTLCFLNCYTTFKIVRQRHLNNLLSSLNPTIDPYETHSLKTLTTIYLFSALRLSDSANRATDLHEFAIRLAVLLKVLSRYNWNLSALSSL